ncbi:Aminodeoxychorismate lyase [Bertholletia excelsa]
MVAIFSSIPLFASIASPATSPKSNSSSLAVSCALSCSRTGFECVKQEVVGLRQLSVVRNSNQTQALAESTQMPDIPLLSCSEAIGRLRTYRESYKGQQQFLAMYSSIYGGITTDSAAMVIPMDDHMVHRGHGVFDTAAIINGYLYELDEHLDRIIKSATMAKIGLPFDKESMRSILIQTASASKCREGTLRFWLSSGPGDFQLSPSACAPALYAIVVQVQSPADQKGVKVVTSSVPIKSPQFATMKSVNYLPNVLSKMEAEERGGFAAIWLDNEGYVAEGSNMNVAFVTKGKELLMPHFEKILSGCTAMRILGLAEKLVKRGKLCGIRVGNITVKEGKQADEMMLIGSGILVRAVLQWDEQIIGNGQEGPVTKALLDLIVEDMKSGRHTVPILVAY